jgi:tetratricopeptide (TPR) repeat protein
LHVLGLAHYRARNYDQAIQRLEESMKSDPNWPGQPVNWITLAMTHRRLGHADQAQAWFEKAIQAVDLDRKARPQATTGCGMHVHDWMAWLLLRHEAEALLSPKSAIERQASETIHRVT